MKPNTLDECLKELNRMMFDEDKEKIKAGTEDEMVDFHFGLGMWMRNSWGLWRGGPLHDHFKEIGLWHADDMSGVILTSFYRYLKGIPLDVEGQVKVYLDFWEKHDVHKPRQVD